MKKSIVKISIVVMCLLAWCSPLIDNFFKMQHFVFIAGYLAGILSLVFIKNKYISFILAVIFMIPAVFLNREYLLFIVCPYLITFEYIQVIKNKRRRTKETVNNSFYAGANISAFAGFLVLAYQYINSSEDYVANKYAVSQAVIWGMFVVCIVLASACLSKKTSFKQLSSKSGLRELELKEIRFIHILNVFCYIETLLFYYFVNTYALEYAERVFFFPWFIYLGLMVCYNDPIFNYMVEKTEKFFAKTAEKLNTN